MTTYSIGLKGVGAGQKFNVQSEQVPDDVVPPTTTATVTVATAGGMAYCMSQNMPFLVRTNTGRTIWMVYDAERSTPTVPVLRAV